MPDMYCLSRFSVGRLAAVSLALGLLTPGSAFAQELEKSFTVFDFSVDKPFNKTSAYCNAVSDRLSGMAGVSVLPRDEALTQLRKSFGGASGPASASLIKDLRAALKPIAEDGIYSNAKKALGELSDLLKKVQAIRDKHAMDEGLRKLTYDVLMTIASANAQAKDSKGVNRAIMDLAKFNGEMPRGDFHPLIVDESKKVAKVLEAQRTSTIEVTSKPAGAQVLLDGRLLKKRTPMTVKAFSGMVQVQVKSGGTLSKARKIALGKGAKAKVAIDLEYEGGVDLDGEATGLIFKSKSSFDARAVEFAKRLGAILKVDKVALCGLIEDDGKDYIAAHVIDVAKGKVDHDTQLVTKSNVVSNKRVDAVANLIGTGTLGGADVDSDSGYIWYENPIGWSLIGLGFVGAGAGVGLHFLFEDTFDQVQCQGDYTSAAGKCDDDNARAVLAEDATVQRALRNTAFVVGGLGLIGGAIVMILMQPDDDESTAMRLRSLGPIATPGTSGVQALFTF